MYLGSSRTIAVVIRTFAEKLSQVWAERQPEWCMGLTGFRAMEDIQCPLTLPQPYTLPLPSGSFIASSHAYNPIIVGTTPPNLYWNAVTRNTCPRFQVSKQYGHRAPGPHSRYRAKCSQVHRLRVCKLSLLDRLRGRSQLNH